MKPLFTIHIGEYLAGERIEKEFPECEIWTPIKDTGTDLLITNQNNHKYNAGIQVKYSKDFVPASSLEQQNGWSAINWFTLRPPEIIKKSNADVWIFALYSFYKKKIYCVIIEPAELARRLELLGGQSKFYLWVTADAKHCFATRGLKKQEEKKLAAGDFSSLARSHRDFSPFLENWNPIKHRIQPPSAR